MSRKKGIIGEFHGLSNLPEYKAWLSAKTRCYNTKYHGYHLYGARGITMCDRWRQSFTAFFSDMGPRPSNAHSLDRIDNMGNYEPNNCRWSTATEQANNVRHNVVWEHNGIRATMTEWARMIGTTNTVLHNRKVYGWPVERILTEPIHRKKRHH
jgi:hypothetical protein